MIDKTVVEKATPRPWRLAEYDPLEISCEKRIVIASMIRMEAQTAGDGQREANAELIVLAVNNYEESAATIQSLTEALSALYEDTANYIILNHLGDVHHNTSMKLARAALALARRSNNVP